MRRVQAGNKKLNKDKAVARFEPWMASWKNESYIGAIPFPKRLYDKR